MTYTRHSIRRITTLDPSQIESLADLLLDAVEGGASIGFMLPLERRRAVDYWQTLATALGREERALLIAEDTLGICGTVQLILNLPDNQPHRADIAKVIVHRRARRRGLGEALMHSAERTARECNRTLLVLDTVSQSPAARLYERLGWVRSGDIPKFALFPDGELCSTTYFYRDLTP